MKQLHLTWNTQNQLEAYLTTGKNELFDADIRANLRSTIEAVSFRNRRVFERVQVNSSTISLRKAEGVCDWVTAGDMVEEAVKENFTEITFYGKALIPMKAPIRKRIHPAR